MDTAQMRPSHRQAAILLAFALAAACIVVLVVARVSRGGPPSKAGHRPSSAAVAQNGGTAGARRIRNAQAPLPADNAALPLGPAENAAQPLGPPGLARRVTLAQAHATVDFPFPVPNTSTAGPANLSAVWVHPSPNGEVALLYGGTAITIYIQPALFSDPRTRFSGLVEQFQQNSVKASLGKVDGHVALVVPPHRGGTYSPANVEFDLNGVDIAVTSSSAYGTATLMDVADNMAKQSSQR
jgi:hypothetical protein